MAHGIFPPALAQMHAADAGQQWTPSNGTEGDLFIAAWCNTCQLDRDASESVTWGLVDNGPHSCTVLNQSVWGLAEEWQIGQDGQPRCLAYVPVGEATPRPRCLHTLELDL